MDRFARRTGLVDSSQQQSQTRYLWTDAFAVCNFLGLASTETDPSRKEYFESLAYRLIVSVHNILGRHSLDHPNAALRQQWISGLPENQGMSHPTIGGLRIGKKSPERGVNEPYDRDAEW